LPDQVRLIRWPEPNTHPDRLLRNRKARPDSGGLALET
jgi:hypothetical protein